MTGTTTVGPTADQIRVDRLRVATVDYIEARIECQRAFHDTQRDPALAFREVRIKTDAVGAHRRLLDIIEDMRADGFAASAEATLKTIYADACAAERATTRAVVAADALALVG